MDLKLPLLLCLATVFLNSATADIFKRRTSSWRFADTKGDNVARWSKVEELVKGSDGDGVAVLALQGVHNGPDPDSATLRSLEKRLINPHHLETVVLEYEWKLFDDQRRFIYSAELEHGVHVVLVSKERADQVLLFRPVNDKTTSPILGIRLQNDYYFTINVNISENIDVKAIKGSVASYFESQNHWDHESIIIINYTPKQSDYKHLPFGECPVIHKSIEIYFVQAHNRRDLLAQAKQDEQSKQFQRVNQPKQSEQFQHAELVKQSKQSNSAEQLEHVEQPKQFKRAEQAEIQFEPVKQPKLPESQFAIVEEPDEYQFPHVEQPKQFKFAPQSEYLFEGQPELQSDQIELEDQPNQEEYQIVVVEEPEQFQQPEYQFEIAKQLKQADPFERVKESEQAKPVNSMKYYVWS